MDLELFVTLIVLCSVLLLIATISICSHIPICQRFCQRLTDLILVRTERSHLDNLPETVYRFQYRTDIECVKQISPAASRISLVPDTEENPALLTHPLPETLRKKNRSTRIVVSNPPLMRETDVPS